MDHERITEVLAPVDEAENRRRGRRVRSKFTSTLKRAARQVPFVDELVAAYYCALDEKTPTRVRGVLLAALAYFVLPLDSIPDFLFGFGFTDDVAVLSAAIAAIRNHITPAHRAAAQAFLREEADNG